jgi:hypothetical protein
MEPVERIKRLTQYLPKGDIALAHTFIDSRDFESLQELVDSAIVKTKRNISSSNPKEEYLSLDVDEIEVDDYVDQLQLPEQDDEFDNYEEEYC